MNKAEARMENRSLDDPQISVDRARLLRSHPYLQALYSYWYTLLVSALPQGEGEIIELGSGGGFLKQQLSSVITSDVLFLPGVDLILDARSLPMKNHKVRAIVGTNVLHHIPQISKFLQAADEVLRPGGRLLFVEPWPTLWSRFVYRFFHHEIFDRNAGWDLPEGGPLTAANGALPWIVLKRDPSDFSRQFPSFSILSLQPLMPISYLVCGGIGRAWRVPGKLFPILRACESPFDRFGLFALITIEKRQ